MAFGTWVISAPVLLGLYLMLVGVDRKAARETGVVWVVSSVLLMFAAYYVAYLTTPHDVVWHLDTSLRRLLMQLWPSALFGFFLIARPPRVS